MLSLNKKLSIPYPYRNIYYEEYNAPQLAHMSYKVKQSVLSPLELHQAFLRDEELTVCWMREA